MIKKIPVKYLLLVVVLIYGGIIVRYFMLTNESEYDPAPLGSIASFKPTEYTTKESFTIKNEYRDPFLGTLSKKYPVPTKESLGQKSQKKEDTYFPTIAYLGVISDVGSNKKVMSLQINEKEYIVKEGGIVDSVRIISGNLKNITVLYKGRYKSIDISD